MSSALFKKPLPYIALLIAHIIWGLNFVVAKITLEEFPALSLAFLRYAFACLLIAPFLLALTKKERTIKTTDIPKILWVGLLMVTFHITLFFEGLVRTTAINASTLSLTLPMFSVLAAWIFLREKIYLINLVGVLTGLFGAITIIGIPLLFVDGLTMANLFGNMLIIGSTLCFVIGAVISKELLKTYSPLILTSAMFLVGAISFLVPAIYEYYQDPSWISHVSVLGLLGLLYITILSSVCAYFLLIWGLKKTNLVQANLFQYIEPAIAATIAVPLLNERISFSFIIGTCLIVLGVYWGTIGKAVHHHLHHYSHRS